MSRRLPIVLLSLLLVLALRPDRGTAESLPANAPSPQRTSALVMITGPSALRRAAPQLPLGAGPQAVAAAAAGASDALRAAEAATRAVQAPIVAAVKQLGARVVSRYTTTANGLLVHATPAQLAALAGMPGVVRIEPAPIVRPLLEQSAPHIGAVRLARELGYDGTGTTVAVIDTGVDYTHAHLGGPGDPAAYEAAAAAGATEVITDTWDGARLFPNEKVIGGWDFVGRDYDPPHICTPAREAAGECTSTPRPDPDPLDGHGHGTHVSGIVAGQAAGALADGVAPGAKIVGLKLYGRGGADEAADVLVDAIEWCARVNLGLETRGVDTLPAGTTIDAINISLGEVQAQGSRLFDEAVAAAVDAGVVVVASAGNSGDRPFVAGAPAASPRAISVASSLPPPGVLDVETRWDGGQAVQYGIEGDISRPLAETGPLELELSWYGLACNDDDGQPAPPAQDVTERMALVERGGCSFAEKLLNAQAAGAVAVLMFTDQRAMTSMRGSAEGIEIPAVMIGRAPGLALRDRLLDGVAVTAVIDPQRRTPDAVSGFSSRGPSKNGALKPDLTAPGSGILSALSSTGVGGASWSGTSMAGPHVAGAAALLQHRIRAEALSLGADAVGALLMNYAQPVVFDPEQRGRAPVPVVRQGAGRIALWPAGTAPLVVRAGDIASVNLGPLTLTGQQVLTRTLHVASVAADPITVALRSDRPGDGALRVETDGPVVVPAGGTAEVAVRFEIDPAVLPEGSLWPDAGADAADVQARELDGYLTLQPIDAVGQPRPDLPAPHVPYYALPRRASMLAWSGHRGAWLLWSNPAPYDGRALLFAVPELDGAPAPEDPDEPAVAHELDLRRVGARVVTDDVGDARLEIGLARHAPAAIPQVTRFEVYIDTDDNGTIDHRVREAASGDQMRTVFGEWDPAAGEVVAGEHVTGTLHATDLHAHTTVLSVPLEALGLDVPQALNYYVVARGLTEDWLHGPSVDVAPDGADVDDGPRYRFDPAAAARWSIHRWTVNVSGRSSQTAIGLSAELEEPRPALLALYPDNPLDGAVLDVIPAEIPEGPATLHLPLLLDRFQLPGGERGRD